MVPCPKIVEEKICRPTVVQNGLGLFRRSKMFGLRFTPLAPPPPPPHHPDHGAILPPPPTTAPLFHRGHSVPTTALFYHRRPTAVLFYHRWHTVHTKVVAFFSKPTTGNLSELPKRKLLSAITVTPRLYQLITSIYIIYFFIILVPTSSME